MGDISFAVQMLKEDSPIVELEVHLNTVYFFFNFPNSSSSIDDIYRVNVTITEWGSTSEGELDKDNILSELVVEFNPARTIYAKNSEDLPQHHAFYDIKNSWYTFRFTYMYLGGVKSEGNLITYSRVSEYNVDNTVPIIYEKYISGYIRDSMNYQLEKEGEIKLWWDNALVEYPRIHQAIKFLGAPGIREINNIYPNNTGATPDTVFTNTSLDTYYRDWLNTLLNDEAFHSTLLRYFVTGIPVSGILKMRFNYNKKTYFFVIEGNLENLAREYFR